VVAIWGLALAVGGTLFWVLPKAASSRHLATEATAIRESISKSQKTLDRARAQLAAVQAELDALDSTRQSLTAEAGKNADQITSLNERIKELKKQKKEAAAAAAAAAAASAHEGTFSIPTPIPPPCFTIYTTPPFIYCPTP